MGTLWSRLVATVKGEEVEVEGVSEGEKGKRTRGRERTRTPLRLNKNKEDKMPNVIEQTRPSVEPNTAVKGERIAHEFIWKYGGGLVEIAGDFNEWTKQPMQRDQRGLHLVNLDLDPRQIWQFKFIVDNVWRCSLDFPTLTDDHGNINNVIYPDGTTIL